VVKERGRCTCRLEREPNRFSVNWGPTTSWPNDTAGRLRVGKVTIRLALRRRPPVCSGPPSSGQPRCRMAIACRFQIGQRRWLAPVFWADRASRAHRKHCSAKRHMGRSSPSDVGRRVALAGQGRQLGPHFRPKLAATAWRWLQAKPSRAEPSRATLVQCTGRSCQSSSTRRLEGGASKALLAARQLLLGRISGRAIQTGCAAAPAGPTARPTEASRFGGGGGGCGGGGGT